VLDSVRAAHELGDVTLADRTVLWGHSQGGGAALWTGGLAPMYAPDVGVVGVAALAPASDLPGLADSLRRVTGGSIFAGFIVQGYANAYDDVDVDDYVRRVARPTFDAAVRRCLSEPAVLLSAIGSVVTGESVFSNDPATGPLSERLGENVPVLPVEAPLLVAQGEGDRLISPVVQAAYVQARCEAGQAVDYRTYPGLDHVPLVQADSPLLPELFDWTEQRFAGAPFEPTCGG
jgi:acetyl esterase/lipase